MRKNTKKLIVFAILIVLSLQLSGCTIGDLFGMAFYEQKPGARIISQSEAEILLNGSSEPTNVPENTTESVPTLTHKPEVTVTPTSAPKQTPTPNSTLAPNDYKREGSYIYFGSYPQSEVTDLILKEKLDAAGGNPDNWTSYDYFIEGITSSLMKYKDVICKGKSYRGVYFTQYRPYHTGDSSSRGNSYQEDNGYFIRTIYWFKYEPIRWKILSESNGEAFLLADMILDAQDYNGNNFNNYEKSKIREWLNTEFLNTAFNGTEQGKIKTANDKVFLLSNEEATNVSYGLGTGVARIKQPTPYAKVQGAYSYLGNSWWWLRSQSSKNSEESRAIFYDGLVYDYNCSALGGIAPALHLTL